MRQKPGSYTRAVRSSAELDHLAVGPILAIGPSVEALPCTEPLLLGRCY
jgi:hypothetical protein